MTKVEKRKVLSLIFKYIDDEPKWKEYFTYDREYCDYVGDLLTNIISALDLTGYVDEYINSRDQDEIGGTYTSPCFIPTWTTRYNRRIYGKDE